MSAKSIRARVLVVTGPGKGKTTSAMGVVLRSLGHGKKVLLARFAKTSRSGELEILSRLEGLAILAGDRGMTPPRTHPDYPKHVAAARDLFARTREAAPGYDLLVLDEICGITSRNMLAEDEVTAFLAGLRPDQAAVLTGRGAGLKLLAAADTVSEIGCLKHCYACGVKAQEGMEF